MPFKERYCHIRAPGCQVKFTPIRWWHRVCNNPACKKENARRISKKWRGRNPEYHKEYNKAYASA